MWMHIDTSDYEWARAGVAVADRVTGPYRYLRSFRPHNQMSRDLTVFQASSGLSSSSHGLRGWTPLLEFLRVVQASSPLVAQSQQAETHLSRLQKGPYKPLQGGDRGRRTANTRHAA